MCVFIILIYVYILISVIEQSYSLIYQVPDRILRWIGGPQDSSGISQLAEQVKSETQQAAGQAGSSASSATRSPNLDTSSSGNVSIEQMDEKQGGGGGDSKGADVSSNDGGSASGESKGGSGSASGESKGSSGSASGGTP